MLNACKIRHNSLDRTLIRQRLCIIVPVGEVSETLTLYLYLFLVWLYDHGQAKGRIALLHQVNLCVLAKL
jgi:hypothetical protein